MYAIIDIETTGLNRYKDKITFIGVGLAEDVGQPIHKKFVYNWQDEKAHERFYNLCNNLRKRKVRTVFQNGKFDTLFIEQHTGIRLPIHEDVMLMATAYDLAAEHGLKAMAKRYLGVPDWDISKKKKLSGDPDEVVPYLEKDVLYTWDLFCFFMKRMNGQQDKIYRQLLRPAYLMYRNVERNGAYIDVKGLSSVREKYKKIEEEKLAALNARYKINWNSSGQVAKVLFEDEGLPVYKKSAKTGKPSADAEVLKKLASKGHQIPQLLLEYKAANTLNKMFLYRWEDDLAPDRRIHSTYNMTNVVTGRTSCSDPNLQQVPRNKDVRGLFIAPKGRVFFEADYSQLELRIAADYANDKTMLEIYRTGGDIHTETARLMTGGREPTKEERSKAKAVNFGFLYGMLAKKFVSYAYNSYNTVFTNAEAEQFRALFFAKYNRLLPWHKEMEEMCEALGGVANKFGRFRKLPNIYSQQKFERLSAVRRAINTPVQGTGSDLLISAATQLMKEHSKNGLTIVGTVHDSILGEFWAEDEEWMVPEIKRIMAHPAIMDEFGVKLKVPLEADVGIGPWGSK